jgi:hypothetical protein
MQVAGTFGTHGKPGQWQYGDDLKGCHRVMCAGSPSSPSVLPGVQALLCGCPPACPGHTMPLRWRGHVGKYDELEVFIACTANYHLLHDFRHGAFSHTSIRPSISGSAHIVPRSLHNRKLQGDPCMIPISHLDKKSTRGACCMERHPSQKKPNEHWSTHEITGEVLQHNEAQDYGEKARKSDTSVLLETPSIADL